MRHLLTLLLLAVALLAIVPPRVKAQFVHTSSVSEGLAFVIDDDDDSNDDDDDFGDDDLSTDLHFGQDIILLTDNEGNNDDDDDFNDDDDGGGDDETSDDEIDDDDHLETHHTDFGDIYLPLNFGSVSDSVQNNPAFLVVLALLIALLL